MNADIVRNEGDFVGFTEPYGVASVYLYQNYLWAIFGKEAYAWGPPHLKKELTRETNHYGKRGSLPC